jgi:hypothetical protein
VKLATLIACALGVILMIAGVAWLTTSPITHEPALWLARTAGHAWHGVQGLVHEAQKASRS